MILPFADGEITDAESGLSLVRPSAEYLDSYVEACAETWNNIHSRYILHDPALADSWRKTILSTFENQYHGLELPEGWFPTVVLWAVQHDAFIGTVNIRLQLDDALIRYGGTYGYFVRTSKRGYGYGTAIAKFGLEATRRLGVSPIVITCQESNAPSMAASERLPYLRKERDIVNVDGTIQPIWRYWFTDGSL